MAIGAGAENRFEAPNYGFDLDQNDLALNNSGDNGIAHHLHATTGSDNSFMLQSWLADRNGPWCLSAEAFQPGEQRKRALAEIDGMHAGLTFLDKVEKGDRPPCFGHSLAGFDDAVLIELGSQYG